MTMTERLLEATKEIWDGYNETPFVKGIADGSLDHEKFKYYMIQDYLYLLDYTKVFSIGTAKAKNLDAMRLFAGYTHSILDGEMDIHRAYMTRLGIAKEEAEQTRRKAAPERFTSSATSVICSFVSMEQGPAMT